MSDWTYVTIEQVTDILGDGLHGTPVYTEGGEYAFINGNNLSNGKIVIKSDTKRVDEAEFEKYKKPLNDRTVLVSINGTLGNVGLYNGEKVILGKSACYFNVKQGVDKNFVRYAVTSPIFKKYLESNATGTTIKNISLKQMRDYRFLLPPYELQCKISSILSAFDRVIEINERLINNLLSQIEANFRAWFLTFEHFDTDLEDGLLGKQPAGWKVVQLHQVVSNVKERVKSEEGYVVLSAVNTGKLVYSDDYFSKQVYSKDISKYIKVEELSFAYNPARVNIGSIGINDLGIRGCVSPVYVVFRTEPGYENYMRYFIKTDRFRNEVITRASGSVRQSMNFKDFGLIQVIYPPREIMEAFNSLILPLQIMIKCKEDENKNMKRMRDALIPKLLEGSLDISCF